MKDTIPFEVAREMKGLTWPDFYVAHYRIGHLSYLKEGDAEYIEQKLWPSEIKEDMYGAPLVSEVLNWLRNYYNIHVGIDTTGAQVAGWFSWLKSIYTGATIWPKTEEINTSYFDSYEDALLRGFLEAFKHIRFILSQNQHVDIDKIAPKDTIARQYLDEAIRKEINK